MQQYYNNRFIKFQIAVIIKLKNKRILYALFHMSCYKQNTREEQNAGLK